MKKTFIALAILIALASAGCKTNDSNSGKEYDADRLPKHLKALQD